MGVKQSKKLSKKFDEKESSTIKVVFDVLSETGPPKGITKDKFKTIFNFSDSLTDRLFSFISFNKHVILGFEELLCFLAFVRLSSEKEKASALFKFFDTESLTLISKENLSKLFSGVLPSEDPEKLEQLCEMGFSRELCIFALQTNNNNIEQAVNTLSSSPPISPSIGQQLPVVKNLISSTRSVFEAAFLNPDLLKEGKISKSKFKKWLVSSKRPPEVLILFNSIAGMYDVVLQFFPTHSPALRHSAVPRSVSGSVGKSSSGFFGRKSSISEVSAPAPIGENVENRNPLGSPESNRKSLSKARSATISFKSNTRSKSSLKDIFSGSTEIGDSSLKTSEINPPSPQLMRFDNGPFSPSTSTPSPNANASPSFMDLLDEASRPSTPPIPPVNHTSSNSQIFSPLPHAQSHPSLKTQEWHVQSNNTNPLSPNLESNTTKSAISKSKSASSLQNVASGLDSDDEEDEDQPNDSEFSYEGENDVKPKFNIVIRDKTTTTTTESLSTVPKLQMDLAKIPNPALIATKSNRGRRPTLTSAQLGAIGIEQGKFTQENKESQISKSAEIPRPTYFTTHNTISPSQIRIETSNAPNTTQNFPPNTTNNNNNDNNDNNNNINNNNNNISNLNINNNNNHTQSENTTQLPSTSTSQSQSSAQGVNIEAQNRMKVGLTKLEQGLFSEALEEVNQALRSILSFNSNHSGVRGEIIFCTAYKVALGILIEVKLLESSIQTSTGSNIPILAHIGLLAKFLADIPLKPNHHAVCVRMAITKNMNVKNFGIAARFLELLLSKGVPDKESVQLKLSKCKDEGMIDYNVPSHTCIKCKSSSSPSFNRCRQCNEPIRWCFKTYELIDQPNYLQCTFCNAVFSQRSKVWPSMLCILCSVGSLEMR